MLVKCPWASCRLQKLVEVEDAIRFEQIVAVEMEDEVASHVCRKNPEERIRFSDVVGCAVNVAMIAKR